MGTLKDLLTRTLRPDAIVGGHYHLQRRVGQGGFGEVWAAVDHQRHTPVALKMMPHQWARLPEIQASLTQECVVLKTLVHPHICRMFDLVHDPTYGPLLITEFVEGVDCVTATKGAPVETCWPIVLQTLTALSYLHGRGVLHLDIKPANLLVATEGVKLIDFGLASIAAPKPGAGTLAYMAPERIRGEAIDARADLYAIGVLLYECLTGQNPFHAPQPDAIRQKQLEWMPRPVSQVRGDCPAWVDTFMAQLLAKDPIDRYPSAKAVLNELQLVLGDVTVRQAMSQGSSHASAAAAGQFIGRQVIMEPLRMAWERATEGTPIIHWVQIIGGAGMGKSRLLRELKFAAQLSGCRTVWCDAAADVTPVAVQPIADALATARSPLVLCLDDYDRWGNDPDVHGLVGLLGTLATHPYPPTPIWCIMTGNAPVASNRGTATILYHVNPFTVEELTTYVRTVAPVPDEHLAPFVEQLCARTDGIPLKVATMMQALVTRGYFATTSGQWEARLFADIVIDLPRPMEAGRTYASTTDPSTLLTLCRHDRATGHAGRALAQLTVYWENHGHSSTAAAEHDTALAIEAAECALTIGRPPDARPILEQCMHRWPEQCGPLLLWNGILWMAEQKYEHARGPLQEGYAWATQQKDPILVLKCRNQLARLALLQKRYDTAIAEFRVTRDMMRGLPPETARQIVNNELGHALLLAGYLQEAAGVLTEEIDHCRTARAWHRALRAQLWRAECRRLVGEADPVRADIEAVVQAARQHQYLQLLAEAYNGLGMFRCQHGAAAEGLAHYEQSLALAYMVHDLATVTVVTTNVGLERLRRGECAKARHAFETVLAFLDQQAETTIIERAAVPARIGLAEIARQEQRYAEALALLSTAETLATQHQLLPQYQFPIVLTRAEIARDQGDGQTASQLGLHVQSLVRSPAEQTAWQTFMDSLVPSVNQEK